MSTMQPRGARRLIATVVSDKMEKTAVVEISYVRRHPRYQKYFRVSRRLKAHNEGNAFHTGDTVVIEATRPLSREKRWRIVSKASEHRTIGNESSSNNVVASTAIDPTLNPRP